MHSDHHDKWRAIRDINLMTIDITNICFTNCGNCTRFCGNFTKDRIWYMDLDYCKKAIDSLKNWAHQDAGEHRIISLLGGEPMMHPDIVEMCRYGVEVLGPGVLEIITACPPRLYDLYEEIGNDIIWVFSPHEICGHYQHTPIMVEIHELFDDKTAWDYIDECWIQHNWSGTIAPKGAYFCEIAGVLSMLRDDGIEGWDITKKINGKEWWDLDPKDCQKQREWACVRCGAAAPLKTTDKSSEIDNISPAYYEILKAIDSPKIRNNNYTIIDKNNLSDYFDPDIFKDYGLWGKGIDLGTEEEREVIRRTNKAAKGDEEWGRITGEYVLKRLKKFR